MTAKEYLSEIQKYKRIAGSMEMRMEELRTQAEGVKAITYDKDRIQVSVSNATEDIVQKLIEVQEQYAQAIMRYHKAVSVREQQIARLPDGLEAQVLALRYCDGKRWEEIAVDIGYTWRHTLRIHGSALQSFARKYKDVIKCHIRM